jgi:hypothetical protein
MHIMAVSNYLATKPAGAVTVFLVVALVCAAVSAVIAFFAPATEGRRGGLLWPSFLSLGFVFFILAFLA